MLEETKGLKTVKQIRTAMMVRSKEKLIKTLWKILQTNYMDYKEAQQSCSVLMTDIEDVHSEDLMILYSQWLMSTT